MPEQEEVLSAADRMAQFRRHMVVQESGLEQYLSSLHFSPDPFQVEALEHLALGSSVLVCAPTGAGKTVVGEGATYLARARGKPVYGYVPEGGSLAERIRRRCPEYLGEDAGNDMQGWQLEEFGLPLNLMLAVPCVMVVGDAEAALQRLRRDLDARHRVA